MKLHLLDLGNIDADEGWTKLGAGSSTLSNPNPPTSRRRAAIIAAVIEHPTVGPILFDTGAAPNAKELWPAPIFEAFPITHYEKENHLDAAIKAAGYGLKDIRAIVLSHLHLDHAGGLEFFRGTQVPIYVHAEELRNAFYAVASKDDFGAYLPHYLDFSFNWQPFAGEITELFAGFTLHQLPGHTPALVGLEIGLAHSGTFFFTSDEFHFHENYEQGIPQGWLMRDYAGWWASYRYVHRLADRTSARLVFGHDPEVLAELKKVPFYD
jgi:glyoxylase-like metal-dependent hydrolase (beta-lactamase superfamily II)